MAMGWLLTTRASMDSCQRRLVSETKTALHQNEDKAAEAIKESKAHCAATIWDAEAMYTVTIREAETACVGHTHSLQQSLSESIQDLEHEAIDKEGWVTNLFWRLAEWPYKLVPLKPMGHSCTSCSW